jgi:NAD(P)-dependent dehydrogenase (short-subunit alcohol dehydrogenase family)
MDIKGSVVLVSGANRGLGLAFAREALARGAVKVYAGMRNTAGFDEPGLVPVQLDVTDAQSVAKAAADLQDVTLLVNNAGIGALSDGPLDPELQAQTLRILDTNLFGIVRLSQAFAPILGRNRPGAIIDVLSNASWLPVPMLTAYAITKAAAWSFTNHLRLQLQEQGTQVLGMHVGFVDTDLTKGVDVPKSSPVDVVRRTYDALAAGKNEVMADEGTGALKRSLSADLPGYIDPASFA